MAIWEYLKTHPEAWRRYFLREKIIKGIRRFFDQQMFHEVETPTLIKNPAAESYLEIFETTLLDRKRDKKTIYLSTSPELALKKLLVAGMGNCYSLTKSFRNMEGESNLHNPEFTILEWYRTDKNYKTIMEDCEALFLSLFPLCGINPNRPILTYQKQTIDCTPPWSRISVKDAFQMYAHIDLDTCFDINIMRQIAIKKGYSVTKKNTWEELYNQIFLNEVEPFLTKEKPVILYDFPSTMAALAKTREDNSLYAERFELYIGGLELADCYTELTNWKEQQLRFEKETQTIKTMGKTTYEYDMDFIRALKKGLPPCAGVALGVDRLVMLLTDAPTIQDVLLFPLS